MLYKTISCVPITMMHTGAIMLSYDTFRKWWLCSYTYTGKSLLLYPVMTRQKLALEGRAWLACFQCNRQVLEVKRLSDFGSNNINPQSVSDHDVNQKGKCTNYIPHLTENYFLLCGIWFWIHVILIICMELCVAIYR